MGPRNSPFDDVMAFAVESGFLISGQRTSRDTGDATPRQENGEKTNEILGIYKP
jgi:hypothetical protein